MFGQKKINCTRLITVQGCWRTENNQSLLEKLFRTNGWNYLGNKTAGLAITLRFIRSLILSIDGG
jgi:hypothetical protein